MAGTEIRVDYAAVYAQADKMTALASKLRNRQYQLNLEKSAGAFAEELLNTEKELCGIMEALATLADKSAMRLNAAADSFKQADELSAKLNGK